MTNDPGSRPVSRRDCKIVAIPDAIMDIRSTLVTSSRLAQIVVTTTTITTNRPFRQIHAELSAESWS